MRLIERRAAQPRGASPPASRSEAATRRPRSGRRRAERNEMLGAQCGDEGVVLRGGVEVIDLSKGDPLAQEGGVIDENDVQSVQRFRRAALPRVEIGGQL